MKTIKGPALFLGQFAGDAAPFNTWDAITKWAADIGYVGVQVPTWAGQLIDLEEGGLLARTIATSSRASPKANGVEVTELSTHLQGQLVAVHPAYDEMFDGFAAPEVRGNPKARQEWAVEQVRHGAAGVEAHGARRDGDLLRRAGLALRLPLAAAAGGADRHRLRRAGAALAADPRRRRGERRRRLLRDPSRRGSASTAPPTRCSSTR